MFMIDGKDKSKKQITKDVLEAYDKFKNTAQKAMEDENAPILSSNEEAFNRFIDKIDKANKPSKKPED
jgi:hypothetical protein